MLDWSNRVTRGIKGVYFWTAWVGVTAFFVAWCWLNHFVFEMLLRKPKDGRWIHPICGKWGRTAFNITPGWNVTLDGEEHLPPDGVPAVIVANHESKTDILMMYFLRVQFRWLSKTEVFKIPGIGQAMRWAHYVPVTRGKRESHAAAMDESERCIHQGLSMLFFPEGTRSSDGEIKAFKLGAFKLARDTQVPVIPVVLQGTANLMSNGGRIPQSADVRIRILPAEPPPKPDEDLDDYAKRVRERIVVVHSALMRRAAGP